MLKNDPPPGTSVRLVRDVRKAVRGSRATLRRAIKKYTEDKPNDLFEIEYLGEILTVERQDIE